MASGKRNRSAVRLLAILVVLLVIGSGFFGYFMGGINTSNAPSSLPEKVTLTLLQNNGTTVTNILLLPQPLPPQTITKLVVIESGNLGGCEGNVSPYGRCSGGNVLLGTTSTNWTEYIFPSVAKSGYILNVTVETLTTQTYPTCTVAFVFTVTAPIVFLNGSVTTQEVRSDSWDCH